MTLTHTHRTHYIYEVDNIPDHRSRRFGCCPCLLAVRASDSFTNKKAVTDAATSVTAGAKLIHSKLNSFCSSIIACSRGRCKGRKTQSGSRYEKEVILMKKEISFEKNYLTVADIKSYLCISSTAAYELTHRKDFPVCRLGSSIRIPTQLFLAWVDKHTRIPADLAAQKEVTLHVG